MDAVVEQLSAEELRAERVQLVNDMAGIRQQLGDRNQTHADGRRLSDEEYWQWRSRATFALRAKEQRLQVVKNLLTELTGSRTGGMKYDYGAQNERIIELLERIAIATEAHLTPDHQERGDER